MAKVADQFDELAPLFEEHADIEQLAPYLGEGLLTQRECQEVIVRDRTLPKARTVEKLLIILKQKGPKSFTVFCIGLQMAIQEQNHMNPAAVKHPALLEIHSLEKEAGNSSDSVIEVTLLDAFWSKDCADILRLLPQASDINMTDSENGKSLLQNKHECSDVMKYSVVESECNPNWTLLHEACSQFCPNVEVNILLQHLWLKGEYSHSTESLPESYYSFPALTNGLLLTNMLQKYYFLQCSRSVQFLQRLVLKLAFQLSLAKGCADTNRSVLRRKYQLWQSGVALATENGNKIAIDVIIFDQSEALLMSCLQGEVGCVNLSFIMQETLKTQVKSFPVLATNEFPILPSCLPAYLLSNTNDLYDVYRAAIMKAISIIQEGSPIVVATTISLEKALHLKPYTGIDAKILHHLFEKNAAEQRIIVSILADIAKWLYPKQEQLSKMLCTHELRSLDPYENSIEVSSERENVCTSEFLIDSSVLHAYPLYTKPLTLYSIARSARAAAECMPRVVGVAGARIMHLETSVYFEPHELLFSENVDEVVSNSFLLDLALVLYHKLGKHFEHASVRPYSKMLGVKPIMNSYYDQVSSMIVMSEKNPVARCFCLLLAWRDYDPGGGTYSSLCSTLDIYSIFVGRNMLAIDEHKMPTSQLQSAVARQKKELEHLHEGTIQLQPRIYKHDPTYPGVCFFGDPLQESIDSNGRLIQWPQVGVELDIPPGAVPSGEVLYLSIWPCLSGPYILPPGWELVSPVYLVKTSNFHFKKPVKFSLAHYARLSTDEDCDEMAFVSARFSPEITGRKPEYHFRVLDKGLFRKGESVGTICITHFCGCAVARRQQQNIQLQPRICVYQKYDPTYPGVCFFGDPLQESIDSNGRLIQWLQVGVELAIPPGAVPSGEVLYLSIWPCLSGPYILPPGWELVSPVYLVKTSNFHFKKPVKFSLAHYARLSTDEDCDEMAFVSARFSPEITGRKPEYHFRVLDKGLFRKGESVGTICVTHFCGCAIAQKRLQKTRQEELKDMEYSLLLYHTKAIPYKHDGYAVFAVSLSHPLYLENLDKYIKEKFHGTLFWRSQSNCVRMTGDAVKVEYPQAVGGWKIKPDRKPLRISQKEVNLPFYHLELSHSKEHYPPRILLTITSTEEEAEDAHCILRVRGLSEPVEFRIQLKREKQAESSEAFPPSPHSSDTLGVMSFQNRMANTADPFDKLAPLFTQYGEVEQLAPYLQEEGLLTEEECQQVTESFMPKKQTAIRVLSILKQKGPKSFTLLRKSLQKAAQRQSLVSVGYFHLLKRIHTIVTEEHPELSESEIILLHAFLNKDRAELVTLLPQIGDIHTAEIRDEHGKTLLHYASRNGWSDVAEYLVVENKCDPSFQDTDGNTPLHEACSADSDHGNGHLEVVKCLIKRNCNLQLQNNKGNTSLHLACYWNRVDIVRFLLSTGRVNPLSANQYHQTPLQLSTNQETMELVANFTNCIKKYSLMPAVKIFVVGNAGAGKSTLVKAIENRVTRLNLFGWFRNVSGVDPATAGISVVNLQSKMFGSVTIHDLAGQHEYYSSHVSVFKNIISASVAALFLVVVTLGKPENDVVQILQYWLSFVENCCSIVNATAHIIVVGSHADTVANISDKAAAIVEVCSTSSIPFVGFVALDCRKVSSSGLERTCLLIQSSCTTLRETSLQQNNIYPHVLYAFLNTHLRNCIACTVSDLSSLISTEGEALLPTDAHLLSPLLSSLNDSGHLLYLPNWQNVEEGCVVINKQVLLSEINGTIFAPVNFCQHRDFATSTGVVEKSRIAVAFPAHNVNLIIHILTYFEFCQEIRDHFLLSLLHNVAVGKEKDVGMEKSYYFSLP